MINVTGNYFSKIIGFHKVGNGHGFRIKPEIINWFEKNNINYQVIWESNKPVIGLEAPYRVIHFENIKDELLFKLTWL